jgi:hypothetical protein
MRSHAHLVAAVAILGLLCACSHPPAAEPSTPAYSQKLPFDRQPRTTGVSPTQSVIPSTSKLPEGTPIRVHLQNVLSSASAHAGDSFSAIIDEPIAIDGQTVVAGGATATGRVLEAKPSSTPPGSPLEPGYLRIVLVTLNVGPRPVMIETSSIFLKGGSREDRNAPHSSASVSARKGTHKDKNKDKNKDIVLNVDRRLNFRLAQAVELQYLNNLPSNVGRTVTLPQ